MISIQLRPRVIHWTGTRLTQLRIWYRTVSTLEKTVIRTARKLVVVWLLPPFSCPFLCSLSSLTPSWCSLVPGEPETELFPHTVSQFAVLFNSSCSSSAPLSYSNHTQECVPDQWPWLTAKTFNGLCPTITVWLHSHSSPNGFGCSFSFVSAPAVCAELKARQCSEELRATTFEYHIRLAAN